MTIDFLYYRDLLDREGANTLHLLFSIPAGLLITNQLLAVSDNFWTVSTHVSYEVLPL